MTAALEDQSEYIKDRMPLFIAGVVGLSFLLLLVAFHSPLISLKAGIMNLLSVGAAYGVMTLVAQGGAVGELIGIDHEVPIAPFMPVMMFAILFGLSMDYEVFLISRIREEYLKDGDTRRAVADGLAKTARVITAAAAIMVVVFLAFLAAPDVVPEAVRDRARLGDLPRRDRRADGARAGGDAAARATATGGSRTGSSGSLPRLDVERGRGRHRGGTPLAQRQRALRCRPLDPAGERPQPVDQLDRLVDLEVHAEHHDPQREPVEVDVPGAVLAGPLVDRLELAPTRRQPLPQGRRRRVQRHPRLVGLRRRGDAVGDEARRVLRRQLPAPMANPGGGRAARAGRC